MATIRVPQDQLTLQAAVDAADDGDTITLASGYSNETVLLFKPVTIVGDPSNVGLGLVLNGVTDQVTLRGGAPFQVTGKAAAEIFDGGTGGAVGINAGGGEDLLIVDYSGRGGVIQTASGFSVSGVADVRTSGVERFQITGSATAANTLAGGAGDDVIVLPANGQADSVSSLGGADRVIVRASAGPGVDAIDLSGDTSARSVVELDFSSVSEPVRLRRVSDFVDTFGAAGDDMITLSRVFNIVWRGGSAADQLQGLNYADVLEGGGGADRLSGNLLVGAVTTASYVHSPGAVTVDLRIGRGLGGDAEGDTLSFITSLVGSRFGDGLTGLAAESTRLDGGDGNDTLVFVHEKGQAIGGVGADTLVVEISSAMTLSALRSDASGYSGEVADLSFSGIERFVLVSRAESERDVITTGEGDDVVRSGGGDDRLMGAGGNDQLRGEAGDDRLDGGSGLDELLGGEGDDWLLFGGDGGRFKGDGGRDTLDFSAEAERVVLTLAVDAVAQVGRARSGLVSGVESVIGGTAGDALTGDGLANGLSGLRGDDVLTGGAGDDVLNGGTGNDTLAGGVGVDTASYAGASGGVFVRLDYTTRQVTLAGGVDTLTGIENVVGGDGADRLYGDGGANRLEGGDGADSLAGGAGDDVMLGGAGNDVFRGGAGVDHHDGGAGVDLVSYATASAVRVFLDGSGTNGRSAVGDTFTGVENIIGGVAEDMLVGDAGGNRLLGATGDDLLWGRAGVDQLEGGDGADRLWGGVGNDVLKGGAGADTFVFGDAPLTGGYDRITDFEHGIDRLEIDASLFGGGLVAGGTVRLVVGANPTSAGVSGGVFLLDTDNGFLGWDADGAGGGAAVVFARVQNLPPLDAGDFLVVA